MQTNVSSIIRVGRYMRFFESIMPHLRLADCDSVRDALSIVAERNATGQTKSRDGWCWLGPTIPKKFFFHPKFSQLDPTMMSKEEREDYYKAYGKVLSKFHHPNKSKYISGGIK